jgi:hypothetical protein
LRDLRLGVEVAAVVIFGGDFFFQPTVELNKGLMDLSY